MNYAKIIKYDTGNWDGINTTIFFSGCYFNCPGCFNKDAQDFNYGKKYTLDVEDLFISYAKDEHSVGVCIIGGEPFQQDLNILLRLVKRIKDEVDKPIHIWTGYTFEVLLSDDMARPILDYIDTLVDGQFMIDKKDLNLKFRGSSNQRVIDVQASLRMSEVIQIL